MKYQLNPISRDDLTRLLDAITMQERLEVVRKYYAGFDPDWQKPKGRGKRKLVNVGYPEQADDLKPSQKRAVTNKYNEIRALLPIARTVKTETDPAKLKAAWKKIYGIRPPSNIKVIIIPESEKAKPAIKYKKKKPVTKKPGKGKKKVSRKPAPVEYEATVSVAQNRIELDRYLFADYGLKPDGSNLDDVLVAIEKDAGDARFSVITGNHTLTSGGSFNKRDGRKQAGDAVFIGDINMVRSNILNLMNRYPQGKRDINAWQDWLIGLKVYRFNRGDIDDLNRVNAEKTKVRKAHHAAIAEIKNINTAIGKKYLQIEKWKKKYKKFPALLPDYIEPLQDAIDDLLNKRRVQEDLLLSMKR